MLGNKFDFAWPGVRPGPGVTAALSLGKSCFISRVRLIRVPCPRVWWRHQCGCYSAGAINLVLPLCVSVCVSPSPASERDSNLSCVWSSSGLDCPWILRCPHRRGIHSLRPYHGVFDSLATPFFYGCWTAAFMARPMAPRHFGTALRSPIVRLVRRWNF